MAKSTILIVCLNPTFQRTLVLDHFIENEVNRSSEHYFDASGKGINAARILAQSGERAIHLTVAGGRNRSLYFDLAKADSIEIVAPDSGSEIRTCTTILSREKGTVTELIEEAEPVAKGASKAVLSVYKEILPAVEAVLISGTKAPGFPDDLYPEMTRLAKSLGKLVVLDLKGKDLLASLPFKPDAIKPNLTEFLSCFIPGTRAREQADNEEHLAFVKEKACEISDLYGCIVAITRGGRPSILCPGPGRAAIEVAVSAVRPLNTIGSGDACAAGLVSSLVRGLSAEEALREGHRLGGMNAINIRPGRI
jgi:tagatose 6-phosphate kinase